MVAWAVNLVGEVFTACWQWFSSIMDKIDGFGFVIAAIVIVFITSLFLMPMRGGRAAVGGLSDISIGYGRFYKKYDPIKKKYDVPQSHHQMSFFD